MKRRDSNSSDSDNIGLMVNHVMWASSSGHLNYWIVDSGATCYMCNDDKLFVELCSLGQPVEVTLGDGYAVEATGRGTVAFEVTSMDGQASRCKLHKVLYEPNLSYNLISESKKARAGKMIDFSDTGCQILDPNRKLIAVATRVGSLYYLNCQTDHRAYAAKNRSPETKEDIWHRRYGHLGLQNLKKLADKGLVNGFDYNVSREISFCESCVEGKHR